MFTIESMNLHRYITSLFFMFWCEMNDLSAIPQAPEFGTFNFITGDNGAGKTRFLTQLARNTLDDLLEHKSKFNKLVCLTTTVYEKFPRPLRKNSENLAFYEGVYSYFGGRVNNNVFSDISPFRTIIKCYCVISEHNNAFSLVEQLMYELGFSSSIVCHFRDEKWRENNGRSNKNDKEIKIMLCRLAEYLYDSDREMIAKNELFLLDIKFRRLSDSKLYGIRDLSSGERSFIITILSLAFSLKDKTLILFDEPENSMHPKWQDKITSVIKLIVDNVSPSSVVVIATHSPLVVSSVSNDHVYTMNLPGDFIWEKSHHSGNNSDTVLKEQFGLVSSRSLNFVLKIQECIKLYTRGENEQFINEMDGLLEMEVIISNGDPLFEAYNTMIELYRRLKEQ